MPRQTVPVPFSTLTAVFIGVVIIAALYFGRDVLVPLALALLLSFVLAPFVRFLQAWYVPRLLAVVVVGAVAFAIIFGLGALMVSQVTQLATNLPSYQTALSEKIQNIRLVLGEAGPLERASEVLEDLGKELDRPRKTTSPLTEPDASGKPIPVEVRQPNPGALQTLVALLTPLIHPLTTTGVVIIFVIFILIQRQDLRNRLVRLAGAHDLQRTTAALDDAGQRLSQLFLAQLAVNAAVGLVIGIGLWIIGVPSAPLWGLLAMIMRFIPYVGALVAAIFPLILAAAAGSGWTMVLMTAGLFLTVEPLVGHVVEPMVFGQSTGLSPVAVITSATFWTWLWGPIGLILATPLTMCLVVVGKYVDRMTFFEVMFGDQPPLTPAELIYQRMLARDPVEAAEQARKFLREQPVAAYYDEILLEGLQLAQADAERDLLDEDRMQSIRDAVAEIIDDLSAYKDKPKATSKSSETADEDAPLARLEQAEAAPKHRPLPEQWQTGCPVLCIPGPSLLDETAALLVTDLLRRKGIGARAEQADALSMAKIFGLQMDGVALICLCYVESATAAQIHYAVRRIRRRVPDVIVIVALFGNAEELAEEERPERTDLVRQSLRLVVSKIEEVVHAVTDEQPSSAITEEKKESGRTTNILPQKTA